LRGDFFAPFATLSFAGFSFGGSSLFTTSFASVCSCVAFPSVFGSLFFTRSGFSGWAVSCRSFGRVFSLAFLSATDVSLFSFGLIAALRFAGSFLGLSFLTGSDFLSWGFGTLSPVFVFLTRSGRVSVFLLSELVLFSNAIFFAALSFGV
jgi:hypothetical protein